jgi:hypothetical protein
MFANPAARYEVRATYFPARFTPEELNSLAGHGINVVQAGAESEPLIIKSQH